MMPMKSVKNMNPTHRWLAVIVVLQGLILLSHFGSTMPTPAYAQIPDAGAQRNQIIDELRTLNGKMDKLMAMLESGKVQAQVKTPDEKK